MNKAIFYKWAGYRRLFKYSFWLFRPFEHLLIRKFSGKSADYQCSPVFILGLPRSGSTLLYQLVTDMFDVVYFDNLVNLGKENIHMALIISKILFKNKPHHCYSSEYGNTDASGLHAPSEAGSLWYRWFPRNVPEVDPSMLTTSAKEQLKKTICSITRRTGKPLVIKNLFMIQRLKVLKELFPEAKYIYIKRNPLYIAQSIYLARKNNVTDMQTEWWSVPFSGYEKLLGSPVERQVAMQVSVLQNVIERELKGIRDENIYEVTYETIDIHRLREQLGIFLCADPRKGFEMGKVEIHNRNTTKLDDPALERIQSEMNGIFDG